MSGAHSSWDAQHFATAVARGSLDYHASAWHAVPDASIKYYLHHTVEIVDKLFNFPRTLTILIVNF
jgi:hypothetical protein